MPTEHLKCVNLKIFKLADWLDKVSILCFEVVEKDGSNHLDDNTTEEELEAAHWNCQQIKHGTTRKGSRILTRQCKAYKTLFRMSCRQ
uniref:Uncharacterized protein n=1 Tax=Zea mays TaxID=4577 RepID=A0A804PB91_MAIZE